MVGQLHQAHDDQADADNGASHFIEKQVAHLRSLSRNPMRFVARLFGMLRRNWQQFQAVRGGSPFSAAVSVSQGRGSP
jgi:hypothetical protein